MRPLRRWAPALTGVALAVLLLHGWLIERIGRRAAAAPLAPLGRPVQALAMPIAEPVVAPAAAPEPVAAVVAEPEPAVQPPAPAVPPRPKRQSAPADVRPVAPKPAASATRVATPVASEPPADAAPVTIHTAAVEAPATADAAAPDAVHVAAGGDSPAPPAPAAETLPTYRTRIPPAARVVYRLSRGGLVGVGELDWQPQGRSYTLRLEGRLPPLGTLIVQTSRGGFDRAGLAPERYTDKRLRRGEQAANFQRDKGSVTFSGPGIELALLPGMQDRLSVMLQLAAIANAWSKPPPVGEHLLIQVVGARGDSHVWALRYEGPQPVRTAEGSVPALHFTREPNGPYDTQAEFWLDGARSYLPVRVRLTDGRGDALELLREAPVP